MYLFKREYAENNYRYVQSFSSFEEILCQLRYFELQRVNFFSGREIKHDFKSQVQILNAAGEKIEIEI